MRRVCVRRRGEGGILDRNRSRQAGERRGAAADAGIRERSPVPLSHRGGHPVFASARHGRGVRQECLRGHPEHLPRLRRGRKRPEELRLRVHGRPHGQARQGRRAAVLPPRRDNRERRRPAGISHLSAEGLREVGAHLRARDGALRGGLGQRAAREGLALGDLERGRLPSPGEAQPDVAGAVRGASAAGSAASGAAGSTTRPRATRATRPSTT